MLDFRLKVFHTVAKRLSFTRAAAELYITQPAVTRHIRELESQFKCTLFERSGNKKIVLTQAGQLLLQYTEKLAATYAELDFDMNLLAQQHSGRLRIGASTTIAQYVLPQVLARFHRKFGDIQVSLISGNTEQIEQALIHKEIDLGVTEGLPRSPEIKYETYLQDELVLVCAASNPLKKDTLKPAELQEYPLLLREHGSGTLDVIAQALKPYYTKLSDLNIEMQLGSTESIKSYLAGSRCLAFLSVHAILKELKHNEFRIIDIKGVNIERPFYFIKPHGQPSSLSELFTRFALNVKE